MKKSVMTFILAAAAAWTCLFGLAGCERNSMDYNAPSVTGIGSGSISSNIGLETSKALNKSNGNYVNLYVENNGPNPVVATINGQSEKTFQPDEKGSVYLEVTQTFWGADRDYLFKVVPGKNGGSINIYYEIEQRDEL